MSAKTDHRVSDEFVSPAETAAELVHGERGAAYGHPSDDYGKTVGAFNAITGYDLTVSDAILFMQLVKISRHRESPHNPDHMIDLAGYAECEAMHQDRIRQNSSPGAYDGSDER